VTDTSSRRRFHWLPLVVVFVAVALNIASAVTLKALAGLASPTLWTLGAAGVLVTGLNVVRFVVWGVAHRKYPLSLSYPLSSMFFPLMLGVSYLYGDPVGFREVAGTGLITLGVLWMTLRVGP
jgi:hypothetical protein